MALTPGTRLGVYDITAQIGEGGMGEVFRARDTKLNRDVAIKVLPAAFADDPERLARFTREAQTLASLNHPNIATIYGIEEIASSASSAGLVAMTEGVSSDDLNPMTKGAGTGASRALVMELVEGEDLSAHIARGPIPVAEALPIARQIAEALEAAHEQGIVHRDLKPANIKVRSDGTVKVLDFGLAKAMDPAGASSTNPNVSHSPTLTHQGTSAGMIIGTAAYMSPEQAKGKTVDKRADIWSFGVVLYEMLTGKRLFRGEDVSDTLAAVLRQDVDFAALPADAPQSVRRLVARCLERDLKRRLRDIGEARVLLENPASSLVSDATPAPSPGDALSRDAPRWRRALPWVIASAATIALVAALLAWAPWRTGPAPFETRLDVATPTTDDPQSFSISPDGRQIVYAASGEGGSRLWLRRLNTTVAEPLSGTDGGRYPFWSPDGKSIAFFAGGSLKRLDLDGGRPQTITSVTATAGGGGGGDWNDQGVILFGDRRSLYRIAATGGSAVAVTKLADQQETSRPAFLPGGRQFVFVTTGSPETQGVYLGSLDSAESRKLLGGDVEAVRYLPPSWLLWIQSNTLRAQRLDLRNTRLEGDPVTIADPASSFSVSDSGLIAYRTAVQERTRLTWFDRSGKALGALSPSDDAGLRMGPRVSPDGRRVVVYGKDVWLLDEARASRFTFDVARHAQPVWSPDASRIVYGSSRKGAVRDLYIKPSGGSGAEELLLESALDKNPTDWSRDGRFLLMHANDRETGADLWVLPMTGPGARTPRVFLKTKFPERWARFSPDGRFVAYMSNESGRGEIYVRPFIDGGDGSNSGQWQVSTAGGISPVWRADGSELYYVAPDGMLMAVPIRVQGTELLPGVPVSLFRPRIFKGGTDVAFGPQYDVSRDGRFLVNTVADDTPLAPITLIQNWNRGAKK